MIFAKPLYRCGKNGCFQQVKSDGDVMGTCIGISFIDSTALAVCKNSRIHSHKVFAELAQRGKTSTGWFFGFKLHLIFNDRGELLNVLLTPGNVDDRKPVSKMVRKLFGK